MSVQVKKNTSVTGAIHIDKRQRGVNLKISSRAVNITSFLVAFSGMIYELSIAQILSATLGGTLLRYAITIGLFTASLGLSAFLYDSFLGKVFSATAFIRIQTWQAWIGLISIPFLILLKDSNIYLSHLPIVLIGFLSGLELPLLLAAGATNNKNYSLAFDYIGMFTATVIFPLVLLPSIGVICTMISASLLNALIALKYSNYSKLTISNVLLYLVSLIDVVALLNQEKIVEYASKNFI